MIKQRKIELLAPAKNLECGIEAINHGADAVYIGAPKFGARAAAVNSLEDIAALVQYAHLYNARIYVTVNTILKEEELKETEEMIHALYRIGVDALIVQDMGITKLNLPRYLSMPVRRWTTVLRKRCDFFGRQVSDKSFWRANYHCVK